MNEDLIMKINKILLTIMGLCFFPIIIYGLSYVYSQLGIDMFASEHWKGNLGDFMVFYGLPITLIILGFYKYNYNKYMKLIDLKNDKDSNEENELENLDNEKDA